ncbi:MAG TPA: serine/threonine-protein kinase, partial [Kofleriaceae bacterium]|nr:serine/threonine-protein kinase [Kofleriaceae bacterium]
MSTSGTFPTPEQFGDYLVYERLGFGGMATVHRAKKRGIEGFERTVALKRLLDHLVDDEAFVRAFVREARLASYLHHANVVQILDLGRVGPTYYIAMEYLRGRDLRQIMRQARYAAGAPPLPVMLSLFWSLCDALDYAHTLTDDAGQPLGIVHRDVSPSNLIVASDGHLKVIDFGIAGAQGAGLRTQSGMVKGKFAYMAPEIA